MKQYVRGRRQVVGLLTIFLISSLAFGRGVGSIRVANGASSALTLPSDKQVYRQRQEDMRALALARGPVNVNAHEAKFTSVMMQIKPSLSPFHRLDAGVGTIVETGQAPYPAIFSFENHWYANIGGGSIVVYAGAVNRNGNWSQGIIAVEVNAPLTGQTGIYMTPIQAGSVHIVSAVGQRLTLAAANGRTFTFDLPSHTFVSP